MTPSKTLDTDPRLVLQQALLVGEDASSRFPDQTPYDGGDIKLALDELEFATLALRAAHKALVRIARGATAARTPALYAALHEAIARDLINPANELATSDLAYALAAAAEATSEEG